MGKKKKKPVTKPKRLFMMGSREIQNNWGRHQQILAARQNDTNEK